MKTLLLVLLVGAVCADITLACFCSEKNKEIPFHKGREYVYRYDSQSITAIPESSKTSSGVRLIANVRVQFRSLTEVIIQLEKVSLYSLNREIPDNWRTLPLSLFSEETSPSVNALKEWLLKPIQFRYHNGKVSGLIITKDEPFYSVNLKKSILSAFQVQIEKRLRSSDVRQQNRVPRKLLMTNSFSVMEDDVTGNCQSVYTMRPISRLPHTSRDRIEVSKVRNYRRCSKQPYLLLSNIPGVRCQECQTTPRPKALHTRSHSVYNISGDTRSFMIHDVEINGYYKFAPFSERAGQVITLVRSTLKIIHSQLIKNESKLVIKNPSKPLNSLLMTIPQLEKLQNNWPEKPSSQPEIQARLAKVELLLKPIAVRLQKRNVPRDTPHLLLRLNRLVKESSSLQLQAIYEKYVKSEPSDLIGTFKRRVLLDLLPYVESRRGIEIMTELMTTKAIPTRRSLLAMASYTFHQVPTPFHVERLIKIYKLESLPMEVRHASLLSLSSLIHTICDKSRSVFSKKQCSTEFKQRYTKIFSDLLKEKTERKYRIVILKSIGNAGLYNQDLIKQLSSIIFNEREDLQIRTQAIYSLRRILKRIPETVTELMLSVFMRKTWAPEIRMAAYSTLTDTRPNGAVLQLVAQSLYREPSIHVGSFVYSHLQTMSKSRDPCYQRLSKRYRIALDFAKPFMPGLQYSKSIHRSMFSENFQFGNTFDLKWITGKQSMIPESLMGKSYLSFMGRSIHMMEMGYSTEGLNNIIEKMMRMTEEKVPVYEPSIQKMKEIDEKLKVTPRARVPFSGSVYVKFYGNEVALFNLDQTSLTSFVSGLMSSAVSRNKRTIDLLDVKMPADLTYQIPTVAGFPLSFNMTAVTILKAAGSYQTKFGLKSSISAEFRPSMTLNVFGKVGMDMTVLRSGIALNFTLHKSIPVSGSLDIDLASRKYQLNINPPAKKRQLFVAAMEPTTFIIRTPLQPNILTTTVFRELIPRDISYKYTLNDRFLSKYTGLEFGILRNITHNDPLTVFGRQEHFHISVKPGESLPTSYQFEASLLNKRVSQIKVPKVHREKPTESSLRSWMRPWARFMPVRPQEEKVLEEQGQHYGMTFKITGKGTQERQWLAQLGCTVSNRGSRLGSYSASFKHSSPPAPVPKYEVLFEGHWKSPNMIHSQRLPRSEEKQTFDSSIYWGPVLTKSTPRITIKETIKKGPEQIERERELRQRPLYLECERDLKVQRKRSPACLRVWSIHNDLFTREAEIHFQKVPETHIVRKYISSLFNRFMWWNQNKLQIEDTDVKNEPNKIVLKQVLQPLKNTFGQKTLKLNIDVKMPTQNVRFVNISAPQFMHFFVPSMFYPWLTKVQSRLSGRNLPAKCVLDNDYVTTFERKSYKARLPSGCESILTQDCSSQRRFKVLVSQPRNSKDKVLQLLVSGQQVKVELQSSGSQPKMKVNDKVISRLPYELKSQTSRPIIRIIKMGEVLKVEAPIERLSVVTDGKKWASVHVSPFIHRGRLCGMCGTFSGEPSELVEPSGPRRQRLFPDTYDIYTIPSPTCKIPSPQLPKVKLPILSTQLPEVELPKLSTQFPKVQRLTPSPDPTVKKTVCSILKRHVTVTRVDGTETTVCFSIRPVRVCSPGCSDLDQVIKPVLTLVRYHCLPADLDSTKQLQELVKTREVLHKLENKSIDYKVSIKIPKRCKPMI